MFRWAASIDEMPSHSELTALPWDDHVIVTMLFFVRRMIWEGTRLSGKYEALWTDTQATFPDWPLFQRKRMTNPWSGPASGPSSRGQLSDLG